MRFYHCRLSLHRCFSEPYRIFCTTVPGRICSSPSLLRSMNLYGEHMKLSFFPVLLYAFFLSYIRQPEKEFHTLRDALLLGNFVGTFSIPVLFTPIPEYWDVISLPQISPSFCSVFSLLSDLHGKERIRSGQTAGEMDLSIDCASGSLFFIFTFYPPRIGLFLDLS